MTPLVTFDGKHPAFRADDGALLILGSTGSIGQSALKIVRQFRDRFKVNALAAHSNWQILLEQINEFEPEEAYLSDPKSFQQLQASYSGPTRLHCGLDQLIERCGQKRPERVIAGMVGMVGLRPLIAALSAAKCVCLANKESIIVGARIVKQIIARGQAAIIPVDSEHSALYQLLLKLDLQEVKSLVLTASGGPFLDLEIEKFDNIAPEQAVKHPRWNMGAKISVDSATLVNKALELAEAYWLFGFPETSIDVIVHPQSIVHGAVRLKDGTELAHLSVPDMQGAIGFAMTHPGSRLEGLLPELAPRPLEFRALDHHKFRAVSLMRQALAEEKEAVFNVANELAVAAFLSRGLLFSQIVPTIEETLNSVGRVDFNNLEDLDIAWQDVSRVTQGIIKKIFH